MKRRTSIEKAVVAQIETRAEEVKPELRGLRLNKEHLKIYRVNTGAGRLRLQMGYLDLPHDHRSLGGRPSLVTLPPNVVVNLIHGVTKVPPTGSSRRLAPKRSRTRRCACAGPCCLHPRCKTLGGGVERGVGHGHPSRRAWARPSARRESVSSCKLSSWRCNYWWAASSSAVAPPRSRSLFTPTGYRHPALVAHQRRSVRASRQTLFSGTRS